MRSGPAFGVLRGALPLCLLVVAAGMSHAAGRAAPASASAPRSADGCPAIEVPAGDGDLRGLLQKAADAGGFTLHYAAQARQVSGFQGRFTASEFLARLGREAGLVVQYRRVAGCPEYASIARLWVLPTQYPSAPPAAAVASAAPAAAPARSSRPSLAEEAEAQRRRQEDAENAVYVNQN